MRTITFGLALALVGGIALAPVAAAGRQNGVIAGSAAAEAKQPYSQYVMRARDVSNNSYPAQTTLDASGQFALNGLTAGTFVVELVKVKSGQGPNEGKVVCTAGPFTLQDGSAQIADLMIKKGANVSCNRPQAAYILLAGAAAAGVAAGVAGSTVPPTVAPAPAVSITPTAISGGQ
jgi:hypothetical protein